MEIRQRLNDARFEKEVARRLEEAEKWLRQKFDDEVLPQLMQKDADERRQQLERELAEHDPQDFRVTFEAETLPGLLKQAEERIRATMRDGSRADAV